MRDNPRVLTWAFLFVALVSAAAVIIAAWISRDGHQSSTITNSEIYADKDWQNTEVFALDGQTLEIKYLTGKWSECATYGCPFYDANGAETNLYSDNVMRDCKDARLIGRISGSEPFCVGNYFAVQIKNSGYLELRINDDAIDDNEDGGSVTVQIKIIK